MRIKIISQTDIWEKKARIILMIQLGETSEDFFKERKKERKKREKRKKENNI